MTLGIKEFAEILGWDISRLSVKHGQEGNYSPNYLIDKNRSLLVQEFLYLLLD